MSVTRDGYTGITQVLDREGQVLDDSSVPDVDDDTLLEMYDHMKLARQFDERAFSLARQGRIIEMAYERCRDTRPHRLRAPTHSRRRTGFSRATGKAVLPSLAAST